MTDEVIAPLDAYITAKPDEPTFTLQGGDPLAGPLVRTWAFLARRRAGAVRFVEGFGQELIEAAIGHSVADDDREREGLLIRATAAEQVSWTMDDYRKGNYLSDHQPDDDRHTHLDELQRIDLHDLRVRFAQRLSSFRSELADMRAALVKAGFEDYLGDFLSAENHLAEANRIVEPRRMMKGSPHNG